MKPVFLILGANFNSSFSKRVSVPAFRRSSGYRRVTANPELSMRRLQFYPNLMTATAITRVEPS